MRKKQKLEEALKVCANLDTFNDMQNRYLSRENFLIAKTVNDGCFNSDARNSREGSLNDESSKEFVRT